MSDTKINYKKTHQGLLKDLPKRTRDVIERRFGLEGGERETLEIIGQNYGVCRERVRQIEQAGINLVKKEIKKPSYQKVFQFINDKLQKTGDLKREDLLISEATSGDFQNQTLFWLTLGDQFFRFSETKDLYPLWTINLDSLNLAKNVIKTSADKLQEEGRLFSKEEMVVSFKKEFNGGKLTAESVISYLEVSKQIEQGPEGLFGLKEWPEVNPRGIKDKAYLALKKEDKPLHFSRVAQAIDGMDLNSISATLPQTVHNELIRDGRFVLVGRGIYALKEWGYYPGQVREVITRVIQENKNTLSREEIVEKVLSQRVVKENTILLNLQNKKYFDRNSEGKYTLKEA